VTSTELLLLFSFVSLAPVILFTNLLVQALKGAERVGVESRWGGIGGGGGGWGLTRPATWLLLALFFVTLSGVLISATADRAAETEARRDGLVLEVHRRSVSSHQDALAALESAQSEPQQAAALAQLKMALASHEAAVSSLELLWGKPGEDEAKSAEAKPAEAKPAVEAPAAEKPAEEIRDLNPRAVDP
jgi:hypothetical protein